ncbi:MAG: NADH-quinone oxidoreductase subunit K [Synechocystis sp.]|jgi:multicomponent Na+:H+ antiporter subunit C
MVILEACLLGSVLIGFLGLLYKHNLMMKIIAMDVMSTGVIAFYCLIAARTGFLTPIVTGDDSPLSYADPVPQAVILTAIVIGLSVQALMLVATMKLAQDNPTLEVTAIEKRYWP